MHQTRRHHNTPAHQAIYFHILRKRENKTDSVSIMVSRGVHEEGEARQAEAEGRKAKGGSLSVLPSPLTPQAACAHAYMHKADLLEVQALAD